MLCVINSLESFVDVDRTWTHLPSSPGVVNKYAGDGGHAVAGQIFHVQSLGQNSRTTLIFRCSIPLKDSVA